MRARLEGKGNCIERECFARKLADPKYGVSMTTEDRNTQLQEATLPVCGERVETPIYRHLPFLLLCSRYDSLLISLSSRPR